jgi:hypothetical protein
MGARFSCVFASISQIPLRTVAVCYWKAKIFFQSSFMLTTVQPLALALIEGLVEFADEELRS